MSYINWDIKTHNASEVMCLSKEINCSEILAKLLINRNIKDPTSAVNFLNPCDTIRNPFTLSDMDKAVSIIARNIKANKKICIYGDYDVDGITSVSTLYLYLRRFSDNIGFYIPDRFSQGYGVNDNAIKRIFEDDYSLIITVDTGISAVEEISFAKQMGLDVVVTDHHECQETLPNADAIVNPKRHDDTYSFKELAGVGVVYKLILALDIEFNTSYADDYLDLIAIGTVADIMPLVDENRYIVKKGIEKIISNPNPGLKYLIDLCSNGTRITAGSIGYAIAPRINAAGRLENAELGVELFTTPDSFKAEKIANRLCELNSERQVVENQIMKEAIQIINDHDLNEKYSALVLWKEGWHSGVIGIVASKLKEKYNKPVILFTVDDVSKGSGRSVAPFNLYEVFEQNKDLLIQFGGHKYAAGVLIPNDKLFEFRNKVSESAKKFLKESSFVSNFSVECILNSQDITFKTATDISQLQPFGKHNEVPLFCLKNVKIADIFPLSNNKHLRIKLQAGEKNFNSVYFSVDMLSFDYREGDVVDVVFEMSENDYKNHKSVQLIIRDMRYSQQALSSYEQRRYNCDNIISVIPTFLPTRSETGIVYRYFHHSYSQGRKLYNLDTISNIINKDCLVNLNYEKVYYSIKVLIELGVIIGSIDKNDLVINKIVENKKFSLANSSILMSIYKKAGVNFGN